MDPTKGVSWILYGTKQRTSLRPSHLRDLLNTKSSLWMKVTTRPQMYNSFYGQILRHFITTADSFSPATTKTKSSNLFIPDVPSLISPSRANKRRSWQDPFSSAYKTSWMRKGSSMIKKFLLKLSPSTSQIFEESSTNVKGMQQEEKLTQQFLHPSQTLQ